MVEVGAAAVGIDRGIARFNLVAVVVAEPGDARQPTVAFELQTNLFVDAGFRFQVIVTLQIAAARAGIATLTFTVENVVRVGLIQARRFIGASDTHLQREVVPQALRQVEGRAPVVADDAVMIETQPRRYDGAVSQLHIVFGKQRENFCF